uniref:Large ribosomal subunit protein bL28c n=1 Tax=Bulboplastis apyrenoidosa TaxID=1070855 RepID=A0A1Y9TM96_9RHOD|nr:50S ribosomal protein L28 [Bulboplastis apyrenoidosa]ARO90767.1 50S ribosomal protein L28 [Bulboplastis apyrenoidosa]
MKKCSISGKKANNGYKVSFSNKKSRKIQNVNLQRKKIWDKQSQKWTKVLVSTKALKSL